MKQNSLRPLGLAVGLFIWFLLLVLPRPGFAIDAGGNCDIGNISGDCTINTLHEPLGDVAVVGSLTIQSGGEIRFGNVTRTLTIGNNLIVEAGGSITAQGGLGSIGGDLAIQVQGNVVIDGLVAANGGPSGAPGNAGGSGGMISITVLGIMSGSGTLAANGIDGSNGSSSGSAGTPGGNGGNGGAGGEVVIACGGNFTNDGIIAARGGRGGNGGNGQNISGGPTGNGGNGGNGGTGGPGGSITLAACGDLNLGGSYSVAGGVGGNGGNGGARSGNGSGNGGDGGNNGSGGNGGSITIAADGNVVVSGTASSAGGVAGAVGTGGSCTSTGCGSAGSNGNNVGVNGATGSIGVSTAQSSVTTDGAIFDPDPVINTNQVPICSTDAPEGCGLGYWKNHTSAWAATGYLTTNTVGAVFSSAPPSLAGSSLLDALSFKGGSTLDGAKQILLRQAVAALLNAAHPDVNYPRTVADVIAAVNAQLASSTRSTILTLAGQLDADNNLGCPLN